MAKTDDEFRAEVGCLLTDSTSIQRFYLLLMIFGTMEPAEIETIKAAGRGEDESIGMKEAAIYRMIGALANVVASLPEPE